MMKRIGELKADLRNCITAIRVKDEENARLKAEVEHLLIFCNCTLIPSKELQAKVERLTKAGDRVLHVLLWTDEYDEFRYKDAKKVWDDAKNGGQS
jgi:hypothetical protein